MDKFNIFALASSGVPMSAEGVTYSLNTEEKLIICENDEGTRLFLNWNNISSFTAIPADA